MSLYRYRLPNELLLTAFTPDMPRGQNKLPRRPPTQSHLLRQNAGAEFVGSNMPIARSLADSDTVKEFVASAIPLDIKEAIRN